MTILDPFNQLLKEFNNDTTKRLPQKEKLLHFSKYDRQDLIELCVDFFEDESISGDIMYILSMFCARSDFAEGIRDDHKNSTRKELIDMLERDIEWKTYRDEIERLEELEERH